MVEEYNDTTEQKDSKIYSVTKLKYSKTTIQIWQDENNYWLQITYVSSA